MQAYNAPGKLKNFKSTLDEVRGHRTGRETLGRLTVLQQQIAAMAELSAYLDQAMAVLPEDDTLRQRMVETQRRFLEDVRDPSRANYDDLGHRWRQDLETLRADYRSQYALAHTGARLNLADDRKKVALLSSDAVKQLAILADIPIVPRQELDGWRAQLAALRVCPGLTEATLQATPVCPECNYRPAAELSVGSASGRLHVLSDQLDSTEVRWTNLLLENLADPVAEANLALLAGQQRIIVRRFTEERRLPAGIDGEFVAAMTAALSALEPITVTGGEIVEWLTSPGMPCAPNELQGRFQRSLENLLQGKDSLRVRILITETEDERAPG